MKFTKPSDRLCRMHSNIDDMNVVAAAGGDIRKDLRAATCTRCYDEALAQQRAQLARERQIAHAEYLGALEQEAANARYRERQIAHAEYLGALEQEAANARY